MRVEAYKHGWAVSEFVNDKLSLVGFWLENVVGGLTTGRTTDTFELSPSTVRRVHDKGAT